VTADKRREGYADGGERSGAEENSGYDTADKRSHIGIALLLLLLCSVCAVAAPHGVYR